MAKILKIQTGTVDVVVTEQFEDEAAAQSGTEPSATDVQVENFKVDNTKFKQGEIKDE